MSVKIKLPDVPYKVKVSRNGKIYYKILCSYCDEYIIVAHGKAKNIKQCPHCNVESDWILKPKTERILFELQDEYLSKIDMDLFNLYSVEIKKKEEDQDKSIIIAHEKNMDKDLLCQIYLIVMQYVSSLLKKLMKKKGFYLKRYEFIDKVEYATFLWYEQFTKQPFKINDSWAGQLKWKITEALYKYKEDDTAESLDHTIKQSSPDNRNSSMYVLQEKLNFHNVFLKEQVEDVFRDNVLIINELQKLFYLILKTRIEKESNLHLRKDWLIAYNAFIYFLRGNIKKVNEIYSVFGIEVKRIVEGLQKQLRDYLVEHVA